MSTYKALGLKKGGSAFSYFLSHVKHNGTEAKPARRLVVKTMVKNGLEASVTRWSGTWQIVDCVLMFALSGMLHPISRVENKVPTGKLFSDSLKSLELQNPRDLQVSAKNSYRYWYGFSG